MEEDQSEWQSVTLNYQAIHDTFNKNSKTTNAILGDNAIRLLELDR